MGSCSGSIGVACPNDSSSYSSSYSDSSSMTSGINLVKEIVNFRTLHDTKEGTKSQTMSFIGLWGFYFVFSFSELLCICAPLWHENALKSVAINSYYDSSLTIETRLLGILTSYE